MSKLKNLKILFLIIQFFDLTFIIASFPELDIIFSAKILFILLIDDG